MIGLTHHEGVKEQDIKNDDIWGICHGSTGVLIPDGEWASDDYPGTYHRVIKYPVFGSSAVMK